MLRLWWYEIKVYKWGFPCLDYSFDVLTSQIGNANLYNWFSCFFTHCLTSCPYLFIACLVYLSHALHICRMIMLLCSLHRISCMLSDSDLLIYMYLLDLGFTVIFLYVTCHFLYLRAWTTSLDHVHVCLLCTPSGFIFLYSLGLLTTLDSHVQILESGPRRPCCTWSEWRSGSVVSYCLFGPSSFPPLLDWLARFSSCHSWVFSISYCASCFCASYWSYILQILYHALW